MEEMKELMEKLELNKKEVTELLDFNNDTKPLDVVIRPPARPMKFDFQKKYSLPPNSEGIKGFALILNLIEFDIGLKLRKGAEYDECYMRKLWTQLGYEIHPSEEDRRKNINQEDLKKILEKFRVECACKSVKSIVVFIGSHGAWNKVAASDSVLDLYGDILEEFSTTTCYNSCPNLMEIPKIFLINTCQELANGRNAVLAANMKNTLVCTAQLPGSIATRDDYKGSWFVYYLTYVFTNYAHKRNLREMLDMVKIIMSNVKDKEVVQKPAIYDFGLRDIYFFLDSEDDQPIVETTNPVTSLKEITEYMTWDDLSYQLKSDLRHRAIFYQGEKMKLERMSQLHQLDGKILANLGNGKKPCFIVNQQVPDKLKYYIQRKVKRRTKLSREVFQTNIKDVFMFEGVEKHELSGLVPTGETTDVSGNQLQHLSSRFILLECGSDFERICKTACAPAHRIRCVEDAFEIVESHGSVKNLQSYVSESHLEHDMTISTNRINIISDSPGMGKSCLLANIAHHMLEQDPMRIVRFIVLTELVQLLNKRNLTTDTIVRVIAEQSSEYEFGRKLVENALKTQPCVLLFDGFDEVFSNQVDTAKKILQEISTLKLAQIFITTRPHYRAKLETALNVFGYTMQPFDIPTQVSFLTNCWKTTGATKTNANDSTVEDLLTKFAKACLEELKFKMSDFEREIAGIPLQCRLIAKTYENDAKRCLEMELDAYQNSASVIFINSMFEMYKKHMEMRFHKIIRHKSFIVKISKWFSNRKSRYKAVKHAHMYYALKLLFPNHVDQFSSLKTSISVADLCGKGVIEATSSDNIRFVHRTFAEYLVAWYVEDRQVPKPSTQFITSTILKTTQNLVSVCGLNIQSCQFVFQVICYFLNGLTLAMAKNEDKPNGISLVNSNEHVADIYMACAFHNYAFLPYAVVSLFRNHKHEYIKNPSNRIINILFVAANNSDVKVMKTFSKNVELSNVTIQSRLLMQLRGFTITLLHVAVYCVKYSLVEYLITKYEHQLTKVKYLFHLCVYNSIRDDEAVISDKIQIIKLLNGKSKQWVDELNEHDKATPLVRVAVHLNLIMCLIDEGADVNVCAFDKFSVLHRITNNSVTPDTYHQVVTALYKRRFKHFNKFGPQNITPLHCAVSTVELLPETLDLFQSARVNFKELDESGGSVLFYAICAHRSLRLMQALIDRGADCSAWNCKRESVLHISVKHTNYEALQYFLDTHLIDINSETSDGFTPLHYAVRNESRICDRIQSLLINKGADVKAKAFNKTPFLEAFLYEGLTLNVIHLMEKHGLEITPAVASKVLKNVLLGKSEHMYLPSSFTKWQKDQTILPLLTFLIERHATLDFEFTSNVWKWEGMKRHLTDISSHSEITPEVLADAMTRKLLTPQHRENIVKLSSNKLKSERFYKIVQETEGSIETLYVLLIANKQFDAARYLDKCFVLADYKLGSSMFVTPPPGVSQFIQSQDNVMVLLTNNCELSISIRRIHETVDKNIPVIHDVRDIDGRDVVVLKCREMAENRVLELMGSKTKVICLCNELGENIMGHCQVETDTYEWNDISSHFIDKLWFMVHGNVYTVMELFNTPTIIEAIGANTDESKYEGRANTMFKVVDFKIGHPVNQDKGRWLSAEMFSYFIRDKLVFLNISVDELRALSPYGHKIRNFGEDWDELDYLVIENYSQFDEICYKYYSQNLHLIEQLNCRYKLLYTKGSDANIKQFYEKSELCDFPHCDCAVDNLVVNLSLCVEKREHLRARDVTISSSDVTPKMRRLLRICDSINVYELMSLLQRVSVPITPFEHQVGLEELKTKPIDEQVLKLLEFVLPYLRNSEADLHDLRHVAVNTLFPNLATSSVRLDRFVEMGIIEHKKYSFQIHETLACYLVVELLVENKPVEDVFFNELTKACFTDCLESHKKTISFTWWNYSEYCSRPIKSFQFVNGRLFQCLNSFAGQQSGVICSLIAQKITPQNSCKWIHAIVNENLGELLKVFMEFMEVEEEVKHDEVFKSEDLVLLAVMNANVSVIQIIAEEFKKQTDMDLKDVVIELGNNRNGHSNTISLLHVAALRGEYSVFQHLLEHHDFKSKLNESHMRDILDFCLRGTRTKGLGTRKLITERILEAEPNLLKQTSHCLLAPNIHVDLIIHLIQLGVDVNAIDNDGENVLHLSSKYMTPIEYDKLVQELHQRGETEMFNASSKLQYNPLQVAALNLELLDSTIDVFSANGVNFNGVNQRNNSVLESLARGHTGHRSARMLQSLILSGSDVTKRAQFNQAVLHFDAETYNKSVLNYFLGCESD